MERQAINTLCASFPGAEVSDPWGGGHDAWKVGGKMFAAIGATGDGVSVKTASTETAHLIIEAGHAIKAPYFHRSWIKLPWGLVEDAEVEERLRTSYAIIRASLTKKLQATLAPFPS
ncbi:MmcQ/YjbR family DNA-binding protein [Vannielia sp.]|uniref:MmcQ/YjbR family DNA-binding protein n=1 Tax=Vannielia sp. TaxID=2813045 RepID=UPI0026301B98|nr:MmcQ/YjbR family DNA-binding protein [Vannielia sp.]MDF1872455.1 MmcQ/YjbR family DNA-binding protein [Vannielia sp.]